MSTQKSTITLFIPQTEQSSYHPIVPFNGTPLSLERLSKILGVTFDPHLFFHEHVANIVDRAKTRLNVQKALCDWDQQRETILATLKFLIDFLFTYAASVWFLNTSPSFIGKLQFIQHSAHCKATGLHLHTAMQQLSTTFKPKLKALSSKNIPERSDPNS